MLSRKYILASSSPRRREILSSAGITFEIITAEADERSVKFTPHDPGAYVEEIAAIKNRAVCERLSATSGDAVVISADTIVYFPETDSPIGKPTDEEDARRILRSLSGTRHEVVTGVVVRDLRTGAEARFHETTAVFFRRLTEEEIDEYVRSGDPMDKAGAYGMQSGGCIFVERIEGDFFNVVGLPVCRLYTELLKFENNAESPLI